MIKAGMYVPQNAPDTKNINLVNICAENGKFIETTIALNFL